MVWGSDGLILFNFQSINIKLESITIRMVTRIVSSLIFLTFKLFFNAIVWKKKKNKIKSKVNQKNFKKKKISEILKSAKTQSNWYIHKAEKSRFKILLFSLADFQSIQFNRILATYWIYFIGLLTVKIESNRIVKFHFSSIWYWLIQCKQFKTEKL